MGRKARSHKQTIQGRDQLRKRRKQKRRDKLIANTERSLRLSWWEQLRINKLELEARKERQRSSLN